MKWNTHDCTRSGHPAPAAFARMPHRVAVPVLAAALAVAAAPYSAFRGNMQRTGYIASTVGIPDSTPAWVLKLGAHTVSSPAVVGGRLYIGARDNGLYAVDAGSGKVIWKTQTRGWIESSPCVHDQQVFAGSSDGNIYSFDAAGGRILSVRSAGNQVSSPAVLADGTVLTTTAHTDVGKGSFSAYGAKAGRSPDAAHALWGLEFGQISFSSPAVSGAAAVAGACNGEFYCVDLNTRKIRWKLNTTGGVYMASPAIDGNGVYIAPGDGSVYAIDLHTGARRWQSANNPMASLPKLARGMRAIDYRSFQKLFQFAPAQRRAMIRRMIEQGLAVPPVFDRRGMAKSKASLSAEDFFPYGTVRSSSPAVSPDAVFVVQKDLGYPEPRFTLRALERQRGQELWRFGELRSCTPTWYVSSPLATANAVFAGWGEGRLYGFDAKSGKKQWEVGLSGDIISSPVLADGVLYAATIDGNVYAFKVTEKPFGFIALPPALFGTPAAGMRLRFGLAEPGHVKIQIYSVNGRVVNTVVDRVFDKGNHTVMVADRSSISTRYASGAYLIRASVGTRVHLLRMLLVR